MNISLLAKFNREVTKGNRGELFLDCFGPSGLAMTVGQGVNQEERLSEPIIIAIDGPAGSGKSTVARKVAKRLRFLYIDTGAMYRALTLKALNRHLDLKDEKALIELARRTVIDLKMKPKGQLQTILDGKDVSRKIRAPRITNKVWFIAKVPGLRRQMVRLQRRIGQRGNCVVEGRDIGTVVFPNADRKFYIDADFKVRVKRRHKELIQQGMLESFAKIEEDIKLRDHKDKTRKVAPLKMAKGAIYLDTTKMTIEEVIQRLLSEIGQ